MFSFSSKFTVIMRTPGARGDCILPTHAGGGWPPILVGSWPLAGAGPATARLRFNVGRGHTRVVVIVIAVVLNNNYFTDFLLKNLKLNDVTLMTSPPINLVFKTYSKMLCKTFRNSANLKQINIQYRINHEKCFIWNILNYFPFWLCYPFI